MLEAINQNILASDASIMALFFFKSLSDTPDSMNQVQVATLHLFL